MIPIKADVKRQGLKVDNKGNQSCWTDQCHCQLDPSYLLDKICLHNYKLCNDTAVAGVVATILVFHDHGHRHPAGQNGQAEILRESGAENFSWSTLSPWQSWHSSFTHITYFYLMSEGPSILEINNTSGKLPSSSSHDVSIAPQRISYLFLMLSVCCIALCSDTCAMPQRGRK